MVVRGESAENAGYILVGAMPNRCCRHCKVSEQNSRPIGPGYSRLLPPGLRVRLSGGIGYRCDSFLAIREAPAGVRTGLATSRFEKAPAHGAAIQKSTWQSGSAAFRSVIPASVACVSTASTRLRDLQWTSFASPASVTLLLRKRSTLNSGS